MFAKWKLIFKNILHKIPPIGCSGPNEIWLTTPAQPHLVTNPSPTACFVYFGNIPLHLKFGFPSFSRTYYTHSKTLAIGRVSAATWEQPHPSCSPPSSHLTVFISICPFPVFAFFCLLYVLPREEIRSRKFSRSSPCLSLLYTPWPRSHAYELAMFLIDGWIDAWMQCLG